MTPVLQQSRKQPAFSARHGERLAPSNRNVTYLAT
jgi:hypothetical protein